MNFVPIEGYQGFSSSLDYVNGHGSLQNYGLHEEPISYSEPISYNEPIAYSEPISFNEPISYNDPRYDFYCQNYEDSAVIPDFSDACLKYMNDILMEEDLDDRPATLQDYHVLQATEKSFYDVLEAPPSSSDQWPLSVGQTTEDYDDPNRNGNGCDQRGTIGYANGVEYTVVESNWLIHQSQSEGFQQSDGFYTALESTSECSGSSNSFNYLKDGHADSPVSTLFADELSYVVKSAMSRKNKEKNGEQREELGDKSNVRGRKNHERETTGCQEERSSKQLASSNGEYAEMEQFDDVLISKEANNIITPCDRTGIKEGSENSVQDDQNSKGSKSKRKANRGKKKATKEVVDLRTLLIQCAEAVTSADLRNANELLNKIRKHATPFGDSVQRVAHYFANGLEARMTGTGSDLFRACDWKRFTSADILRGYKLYVTALPFQRTTYFVANETIAKLAEKATKIHIIDFGIFMGFQWPCFIQSLASRPLGPPRLKITGVGQPKSGFKPAQTIEETGRRLAGYCERFGVPFEFQAIAQQWYCIKPEDFKIEKDELLVASCLFKSKRLPDETVDINSARDNFLKLVKSLNPDLFVHGVINGTFNAPFFITRFREALYHYSSLFDVFEATMLREDQQRQLIENFLYGRSAMNIVACEGSERIERPETYKQWQVRHHRAGFKVVPLDQGIVNKAKAMVRANYHKDFMVEQDKHWLVQGWKGRILDAISCWKPI